MTRQHKKTSGTLALALCTVALAFVAPAAPGASDDAAKVAKLALEVQRAEDLRAVKNLQVSYSQYAQFGLWSQMAALFADHGEAIYGTDDLKGRATIGQYYLTQWGNHREGLAPGGVRAQLDDTPVVNLSADGKTAKGQWHEIAMMGERGGSADSPGWSIGAMENEYVKENGVWKISSLHYYPYAAGSYAAGWKTAGTVPFMPFHYTPDTAAIPVPPIPADLQIPAISGSPAAAFAAVSKRIAALNDEDNVRNLQNAFGYYMDRKMWDDAGDLFTSDAVLEESDIGIYSGVKSIRHSFERLGPQGLKRGQLNDRPLFDMTVTVSPNGREARTRGIEFRELGDVDSGAASLGLATFENRFLKGADGIWRIREMRIFSLAMTDYYQGWNKSRLVTPAMTGTFAPDKPVPATDRLGDVAIPVFFQNHPVTGKPVVLPKGAKIVASTSLLPAPVSDSAGTKPPKDMDTAIADAERKLSRSIGYDAVDNITHAFGAYIMDNRFKEEAALYAEDGWRGKFAVGFCQGPDHIEKCESTWPGGNPLPNPRKTWAGRLLLQPVIIVSEDGKTARERTRLHSFSVSDRQPGVLSGAMYPNNQAKLENGVWKIDVISVEEPYWSSTTYADGWARSKTPQASLATGAPPAPGAPPRMQPDFDRTMVLKIRFWGIDNHPNPADSVLWPDIKPMWFNYRNLVSDREPPNYCPNLKTCEADLEAKGHKPQQ
jgi:hypothetical protein